MKAGKYRHQPIRRASVPKEDGKTRPIGVSTVEDKVVEGAVREVLEAVYELLMEMLRERIADETMTRLVGKCSHVGVLEGAEYSEPENGTTQGSVLSPLLGNIYLHNVLDEWFERTAKPLLRRR